jgi:hypothetical protein
LGLIQLSHQGHCQFGHLLAPVCKIAVFFFDLEANLVKLLTLFLPNGLHRLVGVHLECSDLLPHVLQVLNRKVLEPSFLSEPSVDLSEFLLVTFPDLRQLVLNTDGACAKGSKFFVLLVKDSNQLFNVDFLEHLILGHFVL